MKRRAQIEYDTVLLDTIMSAISSWVYPRFLMVVKFHSYLILFSVCIASTFHRDKSFEVLGKGSQNGLNFLIWYSKAPVLSSPIIVLLSLI